MNRLKYVFGTNVSHTVISHIHKRHRSEVRLLEPSRLTVSRPKTIINVRRIDNHGHQRIELNDAQQRRSKSHTINRTSSEKICSEEHIQKRRKSTCQPTRAREKCFEELALCSTNARDAVTNMADVESESYARMIASYTETIYSKPSVVALKVNNGAATSHRVRRSPFSTASVISIKSFRAVSPGRLTQDANYSTETSAMRCDSRNLAKGFIEDNGNEVDLERTSSYASMIEKYSNAANIYSYNVESIVPRRHASTRFEDTPKMFSDAKSVGGRSEEIVECSKKSALDGPAEAKGSDAVEKREDTQPGWTTRDVIKDPRRITAEKDDTDAKSRERRMLLAASQQAHWLDRVVEAHKKNRSDRKLTPGRTLKTTDENVVATSLQSELKEDQIGLTEMSGSKPSNPISEYIRRGPVSNSRTTQTPTKSSTQSTAASGSAKEPQIELRMTPSHNESVVAINVDETSARATGTNDHLSVVISSKKNTVADRRNLESRSDFGSMQISISEDTVPVKQIEFSINGKPVSELKSILARADKLDVLSSMDKVEIRIPSKGNARAANQQNIAKAMANPSAVLNLHINAKFNEPRLQRPTGMTPETTSGSGNVPSQAPMSPRTQNILPPRSQGTNSMSTSDNSSNAGRFEESVKNREANATTSKVSTLMNNEMYRVDNNSLQESMKIENPRGNSEKREPSNMIPWWSSEGSFRKIKKKDTTKETGDAIRKSDSSDVPLKTESPLPPKTAISNNATESLKTISPENNEERTEYTAKPKNVISSNHIESLKSISLNLEEKSKVSEQPRDLSEISTVQVKSPQRWVSLKSTSTIKSSNQTKQIRLMKKNTKYRTRSVKTSTIHKQCSDTSINSVPPPQAVTFVAVNPKTIHMEPEAKKTDEKQGKVEGESKKLEAGESMRSADETVQNSDTVYKGADFEKSANRSAGVSAKSPSAAGESGSERGKGRTEGKTAGTVRKVLPGSGKHVVDRRMMEILKTMKPIEKRKDGTLIDYGVKVPSRKPSKKVQIRQTKVPVNVDAKKVASVASEKPQSIAKIVRKESSMETRVIPSRNEVNRTGKMSSTTKETSKEVKVVEEEMKFGKNDTANTKTSGEKIVELVKVSSVKKTELTKPKTVTDQIMIVEPVKISSVKKDTLESNDTSRQLKIDKSDRISSMKRQIRTGPENIPYQPRLNADEVSSSNAELKNLNASQAKVLSKKTEKKLLPKETTSISESKKITNNRSRSYFETSKAQSTWDTTDSVKPKEKNPSRSISEVPGKRESAIFSEESEKKAAINNSRPTVEKTQKDVRPLKPSVEVKKRETRSLGDSRKRFKETGAAPFEGTINFSSVNEEKQAMPKKIKIWPGGGEETSNFGGPAVGPAGFKPSRSFTMHSKISVDNISTFVASSVEAKECSEEEKVEIFNKKHHVEGTGIERPEKGLLYASWLQRFKNNVDDDKIM